MQKIWMTTAALVMVVLAGCATKGQQDAPDPPQEQTAIETIGTRCGTPATHGNNSYWNCYAEMLAEANTQVDCDNYLKAMPPQLRERAAEYQIVHGKRPPGLELRCGDEAYNQHLNEEHLKLQRQGIAYVRSGRVDWPSVKAIAQARAEVSAFASARGPDGNLAYPRYQELRGKMSELMQQASRDGFSLTLEEAYWIAAGMHGQAGASNQ